MTKKKFVVTGLVRGKRENITKPSSRHKAVVAKNTLNKNMNISIPKYRWVKNLRIKELSK